MSSRIVDRLQLASLRAEPPMVNDALAAVDDFYIRRAWTRRTRS